MQDKSFNPNKFLILLLLPIFSFQLGLSSVHARTGGDKEGIFYYRDSDRDGFGNPRERITKPIGGYVKNNDDCNDSDARLNPTTIWYKDADGDGYSDRTTKKQCSRPKNYKLATELAAISADCDDGNAAVNPATIWYKDADNDGYSDGARKGPQCARPKNYKPAKKLRAISGDCDDGNAAINPATLWYKDADNDKYSDGTTKKQCKRPKNYKPARELTATSGDCDDEIAIINPTTVWYKDADGDWHSDGTTKKQCARPKNYKLARELTAITADCDDGNAAINPATVWYKDDDGDGYSDGANEGPQCERPKNYKPAKKLKATSGDCDDGNPALHPATLWYKDADGDGYSDGASKKQCDRPPNYKLARELRGTSGDCDDGNAAFNPATVWYKDADGDKYSDGTSKKQCRHPGADYYLRTELTATSGDCNDGNPALHPATLWYKDADGDKYSDGTSKKQCNRPKDYKLARGLRATRGDCNDANAAINPATLWYKDADNDGYSYGVSKGPQCKRPKNYKTATELTALIADCDDGSAAINPATIWYKDADNDGYSDGSRKGPQCERPKNYKVARELNATSGDCDDGNPVFNPATLWYKDADGDGYSDGTSKKQCRRPKNYKLTSELTATSGDCDDEIAIINPTTVWYKDADGDGYSDGTSKKQCERPTDYKLARELNATSGDCDDGKAAINPTTIWYRDADNDGYSDGTIQRQCKRPKNYKLAGELTTTSGDCDDGKAAINPATIWYRDADGDGYSDGTVKKQCNHPANYKLARDLRASNGDCDDGKAAINPATIWHRDTDNDGYSDGTIQRQCKRPKNYKLAGELAASSYDCDDGKAAINPATIWYKDADNDGYSDGTSKGPQCKRPKNYKLAKELTATSGDCDDSNPVLNPATIWYKDADGDGYSDGTSKKQCRHPGTGYHPAAELTATSGDCHDGKASFNPATAWYKDADGDGYSDGTIQRQCKRPKNYKLAKELRATSGDCDDGKAAINPATIWYKDADNDGYSDGANKGPQCKRPPNHKLASELTASSGDCDDANTIISPATLWYKDADGDGYSDGTSKKQCNRPTDYKLALELTANSGDCDDANPVLNPATPWYKDADGDKYSDGTNKRQCQDPGSNYYLKTDLAAARGDCNDSNALFNPTTIWCKDADGDGYSDGTSKKQCKRPTGYKLAGELKATSGDCNDGTPAISPATVWYKDADNDNYSDGTNKGPQCDRPTNYKLIRELKATSGDCNDANAAVNSSTIWYKDADNDNYSDGTSKGPQCDRPANYKLIRELKASSGDCNDGNAAINPATVWYKDADGDKYSDGRTQRRCQRPTNYKLASGLTATNGDCDDENPGFNPAALWYKDTDNDGYSDGTSKGPQCDRPANYKLVSELTATNGDCDDENPALNPATVWYTNNDGDGYYGTSKEQCERLAGHYLASEITAPTGDCNDNDPKVYPGAEEVCDCQDNDCDKARDEEISFTSYCYDSDGDGKGDPNDRLGKICETPNGKFCNNTFSSGHSISYILEKIPENYIPNCSDLNDSNRHR